MRCFLGYTRLIQGSFSRSVGVLFGLPVRGKYSSKYVLRLISSGGQGSVGRGDVYRNCLLDGGRSIFNDLYARHAATSNTGA